MAEPQIVSDPDGVVAVSQQRMARAIVPEEALSLAVVRVGRTIFHLNSVVRTEPQAALCIECQPTDIFGMKTIACGEVFYTNIVSVRNGVYQTHCILR